MIDGSESVSEDNFELQRAFVASTINQLFQDSASPRVGIIEFSSEVTVVSGLTTSSSVALGRLASMSQSLGITNTGAALIAAADLLAGGRDATDLILFMTDGPVSMRSLALFEDIALPRLATDGISSVALGVGGNTNMNQLLAIAGGDMTRVFFPQFEELTLTVMPATRALLSVCRSMFNPCPTTTATTSPSTSPSSTPSTTQTSTPSCIVPELVDGTFREVALFSNSYVCRFVCHPRSLLCCGRIRERQ